MKGSRRVLAFLVSMAILGGMAGCGLSAKRAAAPQMPGDQMLTPDQMREDLEFTIRTLRQVHPATYRGFSDEQEKLIKRLRASVAEPMPARQFYLVASELLCSMHDGHTAPWRMKGTRSVNIPLAWLADGLYIIRNCKPYKEGEITVDSGPYRPGDRVVAIGGQAVNELVDQLGCYIPSENRYWLEFEAADAFTREAYLESLGLIRDDRVEWTVERDGVKEVFSTGLFNGKINYNLQPNRHWVGYTIDPDLSLGVFHLDTCDLNEEYKTTARNFFMAVRDQQIEHVAVDLRRNGGGYSKVVDEFFSYLAVDEYKSFGCEVRHSIAASRQRDGEPWWGRSVFKNAAKKNHPCSDPSLRFGGRLYILTSVRTYSSAMSWALLVKDNGLGMIIGEPPGNQPSCYGDILKFQMPNTGIYFTISFKKWIRPEPANDPADALYPDVTVCTTIEDVLAGRDPQMDKLKELIQTGGIAVKNQDQQGE